MKATIDLAIVGGGLAGGLTALIFAHRYPDKTVRLVDAKASLGGVRTWSFHESDISSEAFQIIKPMITKSWTETAVHFPRLERKLSGAYHTIRSEDFDRVLKEKFKGESLRLGVKATKVTDAVVVLDNGDYFDARCVLDARGIDELPSHDSNGFQKFIGYDIELEEPHGLTAPMIMDATCPQLDGFRFFYLLPMTETKLLVEETFYSDTPELNSERISRSARAYVERRGWKIKAIEREERGVLPIPLTSESIKASVTGDPLPIGTRGGYFHATTGYSLPDAVRVAELIVKIPQNPKTPDLTTTVARDRLMRLRRPWLSRQRFYRVLNRMIFQAAEPALRYTMLQKFYELPQDTIERFYGGRTSWTDRLRIMSGRSPVPLARAFKNFTERSTLERIR